jgi:hypothetical protein
MTAAPDGPPATAAGPPATAAGPPATAAGPPATATGLDAGDLSCYTAALARYLEASLADPLGRIARSVRLAIRPCAGQGHIVFSHHRLPLNDLGDGHSLRYRGARRPAAVLAGLARELPAGHGVLVVTYTGGMPWSPGGEHGSTPHFLLVLAREGGRWLAEDPFRALLPAGSCEPFRGWLTTAELLAAMTPPASLATGHRLRKEYVFGFAVPPPPDDQYQWLSRDTGSPVTPSLPPGWVTDPCAALRVLSESRAAAGEDAGWLADDIWACSRHHVFRYAHLSRRPLTAGQRALVTAASDCWQELPMAMRFAAQCVRRGRPRPGLVRESLRQLARLEGELAGVLHAHGYAAPP